MGKPEGIKIIGSIDLSKFDKKKPVRPENYQEDLKLALERLASEVNQEFGHFLQADGAIDMANAGYCFTNIAEDQQVVHDLEAEFARKEKRTPVEWLTNREASNGIMAEKAITALLHKALKSHFLVARTAAYDDYKHGVDNLIIDKETGTAICGFDEMGADEFHSYQTKGDKIHRIITKGGAYVKYGATIKNGALDKRSLKNVPAFYLAISTNDLKNILPTINQDQLATVEVEILERFVSSLESQMNTLYREHQNLDIDLNAERTQLLHRQEDLKDKYGEHQWAQNNEGYELRQALNVNKLRINLNKFKDSLVVMKEVIKTLKINS